MNLHPQMAAAAAESARIVGGVRGDQLSAATPAADVAALLIAELFRTYQGFAEPVPVTASAPALDRALAQSGRDPAWMPIG